MLAITGTSIKTATFEKVELQSTVAESDDPAENEKNTFFEQNGYVSIEAANYSKAINGNGITCKVLPDLGRTDSAITSFPVTITNPSIGIKSRTLNRCFIAMIVAPSGCRLIFRLS